MPLFDYLSSGEEDQLSEIAEFLSDRWSNVMDEEPVREAEKAGSVLRVVPEGVFCPGP